MMRNFRKGGAECAVDECTQIRHLATKGGYLFL